MGTMRPRPRNPAVGGQGETAMTGIEPPFHYRWRLYIAHGRHQFRFGIWRRRRDRIQPEYRFISIENNLR